MIIKFGVADAEPLFIFEEQKNNGFIWSRCEKVIAGQYITRNGGAIAETLNNDEILYYTGYGDTLNCRVVQL